VVVLIETGALILDSQGFPTAASTEGVLGDPNANFRAGLSNSFSYKGSLNVLFDSSVGGDLWDGTNGALNVFGKTIESANILNLSAAEAAALKVQTSYCSISRSIKCGRILQCAWKYSRLWSRSAITKPVLVFRIRRRLWCGI
jgi:hypothetical protein